MHKFLTENFNKLNPPPFENEVCQHSKQCCKKPDYYDEKKDQLLCEEHAKERDQEYYEQFLEDYRQSTKADWTCREGLNA